MPTLLATFAVVFLVVADAPAANLNIATVNVAAQTVGVSGAVWISAVVVAFAVTLQPLQFRLVQLLEGYWPGGVFAPVAALGIARQRRQYRRALRHAVVIKRPRGRIAQLVVSSRRDSAVHRLETRFPGEDRLLPTALGNVLRCAEDKVGLRYGMQAVTLWPRLHATLPNAFRDELDDETTQLDVSCRLTVTWLAAGVASSGVILSRPALAFEHWGWLLFLAGMWMLPWLAYRSAIESAEAQGMDIEVAIDLYRHHLIEAMRLPETQSLSEDRTVFPVLSQLFTTYEDDHNIELKYRQSG